MIVQFTCGQLSRFHGTPLGVSKPVRANRDPAVTTAIELRKGSCILSVPSIGLADQRSETLALEMLWLRKFAQVGERWKQVDQFDPRAARSASRCGSRVGLCFHGAFWLPHRLRIASSNTATTMTLPVMICFIGSDAPI